MENIIWTSIGVVALLLMINALPMVVHVPGEGDVEAVRRELPVKYVEINRCSSAWDEWDTVSWSMAQRTTREPERVTRKPAAAQQPCCEEKNSFIRK